MNDDTRKLLKVFGVAATDAEAEAERLTTTAAQLSASASHIIAFHVPDRSTRGRPVAAQPSRTHMSSRAAGQHSGLQHADERYLPRYCRRNPIIFFTSSSR